MDNNHKLKNIIELSKKANISLFNNKYNNLVLRKNNNIINECKKKKKKKIKTLSNIIKELSKNPDNSTLKQIKVINKKYENEINTIDEIIKNFNESEEEFFYSNKIYNYKKTQKDSKDLNYLKEDNYIEFYSNE